MKNILTDVHAMRNEIIENRRAIHGFAEIGFDLEKTVLYVMEALASYGYEPVRVGRAGVVCTVGKPGKTILLRADMDALPMEEKTGLSFAAQNGHAHSCGHDCHTAMLLGAARLLKAHESELKGTVKFMFQPAEEIASGAMDMIQNGLLENPKPDAAFAIHITVGRDDSKSGTFFYKPGTMNKSADVIRITVKGKTAHGARPYLGVDSVLIAAHIVIALNELVSKEIPTQDDCLILVGKVAGGTSSNSVAGETVLDVSARANTAEYREQILKRIKEVAADTAKVYQGSVSVEHLMGSPSLVNDVELAAQMEAQINELLGVDTVRKITQLGGGDDFAEVAARIPSALFFFCVGSTEEGYTSSIHQPDMVVNEDALPVGTAVLAYNAMKWLQSENRERRDL